MYDKGENKWCIDIIVFLVMYLMFGSYNIILFIYFVNKLIMCIYKLWFYCSRIFFYIYKKRIDGESFVL